MRYTHMHIKKYLMVHPYKALNFHRCDRGLPESAIEFQTCASHFRERTRMTNPGGAQQANTDYLRLILHSTLLSLLIVIRYLFSALWYQLCLCLLDQTGFGIPTYYSFLEIKKNKYRNRNISMQRIHHWNFVLSGCANYMVTRVTIAMKINYVNWGILYRIFIN